MGWQDRDYYRYSDYDTRRFGRFTGWSVTTWLIAINVVVFVVDNLLRGVLQYPPGVAGPLTLWGEFNAFLGVYHFQFWRFLTFQFLHANTMHLFFNMLALYFFGPMVEAYLGSRRYLAFYLLCGMAGAASYMLLLSMHLLIGNPFVGLVGASAGIFGILIAAAQIAPSATVMLLFPPIPMKLRTLAYVLLGIAVYTVIVNGRNAGGEAAHLGGAALGYVLIYRPHILNIFAWRPKRSRLRMSQDDFWQH
jgi:membrane associated rhomboid family serine protease